MGLYQDEFTKTSGLSKSKSASYRYLVVILGGSYGSLHKIGH